MSFWEKNLKLLVKRWPEWKESLGSTLPSPAFSPAITPKGLPTGQYRGISLHSPYDPEKEALRSLPELENPGGFILGGFGLGYTALALSKQYPGVPLLCVEPDPGLFTWALTQMDLGEILGKPWVNFMVGAPAPGVVAFLETLSTSQVHYLGHRPQERLEGEYFQQLQNEIAAWYQMRGVNHQTLKKFKARWIGNFYQNLPVLPSLKPLNELKNAYSQVPGVVIAAGPSLEGCLEEIKHYQNSMILVAVDTAYNRLQAEGIHPDFLVSTDGQYWNSRHLDKLGKDGPVLVGEMTTPGRFWRGREDKGVIISSAFPFFQDLETLWGIDFGVIPSGGSVATTAWGVGKFLGLSPLIAAGLDLAYPMEENHIRGSLFEELSHTQSNRLLPASTKLSRRGDAAQDLWRKDWRGNKVLTDVRMDLYRQWFESQQRKDPSFLTYSLKPQGQKIDGFTFLESLKTILPLIPPQKIFPLLSTLKPLGSPSHSSETIRSLNNWLNEPENLTHLQRFPKTVKHFLEPYSLEARESIKSLIQSFLNFWESEN